MLFNSGYLFNLCFPLQNDQTIDNQATLPVVKQQNKTKTTLKSFLLSYLQLKMQQQQD